jgi:hypothetical protein
LFIEQVDLAIETLPAFRKSAKDGLSRRNCIHRRHFAKFASVVEQSGERKFAEVGSQRFGCRRDNRMKLICLLRPGVNRRASL